MNRALPRPRPLPAGFLGPLLAMLALAMQLAAVSGLPFADLPTTNVERLLAVSICHSDGGQSDAPAHHHMPACAVCPLCQAIAHAGVLLATPVFRFVAPVVAVAHAFALPPARAPPGRAATAASARGPPATI